MRRLISAPLLVPLPVPLPVPQGIQKEYEELDTVWFMAGSLFNRQPFAPPTEQFSWPVFKQAFTAVQSSVVHLQGVPLGCVAAGLAGAPDAPRPCAARLACKASLLAACLPTVALCLRRRGLRRLVGLA
jgi:hypothetical protein